MRARKAPDGPPAEHPACAGRARRRRDDGSAALETMLVVPIVVLLCMLLTSVANVIAGSMLAGDAAAAAAREASVSPGHARATVMARTIAGDRFVGITVTPRHRTVGSLVTVEVTVRTEVPAMPQVTSRATARVEPQVDW